MNIFTTFSVWVLPPLMVLFSATAGGKKNSSIREIIALMALLLASFFAAARFQIGDDWRGYELYYESINIDTGLIESYIGNTLMLQFEPGYYFVSYLTKSLGATYSAVNAISVASLFFTIIFLIKKMSIPPYFIILIFLGLPLVQLFYNQVRQSFAIAFVLLAVLSRKDRSFIVFSFLALSFQFSTVIFIILAFMARHYESISLKFFRFALIFIPISAAIFAAGVVDSYSLIKLALPDSLAFKVDLYNEEVTSLGTFRLGTVAYVIFLATYLSKKLRKNYFVTTLESRIITTSLLSTLLIPYSLLAFPNSYAFYGRALVFALILLSISGAILHKYTIQNSQNIKDLLPIHGAAALSLIYYFLTLYLYSEVFFPYNSIFFL